MGKELGMRHMPVNTKAVIKRILTEGDLGRRIRDMGLVPGTEIMVIGKAPLRDPVALRVRDFTLTLRNNEAEHILVEMMEQNV